MASDIGVWRVGTSEKYTAEQLEEGESKLKGVEVSAYIYILYKDGVRSTAGATDNARQTIGEKDEKIEI